VNQESQPLVDNPPPTTTFRASATPASGSDPVAHGRNIPASAQPPRDSNDTCAVHPVDLHVLYRATVQQLDWFEGLAREGHHLDFAHAFTGYVLNARIPHLLRQYPAEGTLKVDGSFLDWKVRELKREVQRQYVEGQAPGVPESELASINYKLNLIAGQLAKLSVLSMQKS